MHADASTGTVWQVVDGAAGKFVMHGGDAVNHDGLTIVALEQLLRTVTADLPDTNDKGIASILSSLATRRAERIQCGVNQPGDVLASQAVRQSDGLTVEQSDGRTEQSVASGHCILATGSYRTITTAATSRKWATPHAGVTYYINVNSDQVNEEVLGKRSVDLRDAIIAAANRWGAVSSADFTMRYGGQATAAETGYNGVSEVLFVHKGSKERAAAAEVWYTADFTVVEADIWINDDYLWDTTGAPARNEVDLESALVHEFGHWLILGHQLEPRSIMYPRLTAGSIKRQLQPEDIAGISAIYPR